MRCIYDYRSHTEKTDRTSVLSYPGCEDVFHFQLMFTHDTF